MLFNSALTDESGTPDQKVMENKLPWCYVNMVDKISTASKSNQSNNNGKEGNSHHPIGAVHVSYDCHN